MGMAIVLALVEGQYALLLRTTFCHPWERHRLWGFAVCSPGGWVSYLEPLGERGTTQAPLGDCCELDLLKCTVPEEHTPLKEGGGGGSWPGALPPPLVSLIPGSAASPSKVWSEQPGPGLILGPGLKGNFGRRRRPPHTSSYSIFVFSTLDFCFL